MTLNPYDRAIIAWLKALQINPQFAEILYNIGILLYRAGYHGMSVTFWEEVVQLAPDFAIAWYNLGHMAWRRGQFDKAEECWAHCGAHDVPWPLPYELFHTIVDLQREKSSLASPAEADANPIPLTCLAPDRVLRAILSLTSWQSSSDQAQWLQWLPQKHHRQVASVVEAMLPSPGFNDLMEVLNRAMRGFVEQPLCGPPQATIEHFRDRLCPHRFFDLPDWPGTVTALRTTWPTPGMDWGPNVPGMTIEYHPTLLPLFYPPECAAIDAGLAQVSTRLESELGVVLPPVEYRRVETLRVGGYRILWGQAVLGEWRLELSLGFNSGRGRERDPVFGRDGVWSRCSDESLHAAPYLLKHLLEIVRSHADMLLGLGAIRRDLPDATAIMCTVLRHLLREQVPIRGLLPHRSDASVGEQVEILRRRLAAAPHLAADGTLTVHRIDAAEERALTRLVYVVNGEAVLDAGEVLPYRVRQELLKRYADRPAPVLVTPKLRPALKRFLVEGGGSNIPVLSTREVSHVPVVLSKACLTP
ncbi:MAG TPA: tetratricopeptide repeat protein [Candidatus Xenobia bacterium]|jgi:hypothetical protein